MATRADVITRALRRLRVVAANRTPTADMSQEAGTVLDSLYAEIGESAAIPWALSAVPDEAFNPLADLLAAEIAPPSPENCAIRSTVED